MNVKLFTSVAVIALTMCALGGIVLMSDNSDAAGSGTSEDPYDSLNVPLGSLQGQTIYIYEGSSVTLSPLQGIGASSFTDGFGLTQPLQNGGVGGTLTKTGTLTIQLTNGQSITLIVVSSEEDIDFTSPKSVTGISGGFINYTARTNIDATFSEAGGTGASWLNVNSSSGNVTGTFPSVSSMTSYTYIIKATSSTNSSNTTTQTITINVYPIAKITASATSVACVDGQAISQITLTGNLDMDFIILSGSLPDGVTLSESGVISGTPTEDGSFEVTIGGVVSEGPSQSPSIKVSFVVEPGLTISVGGPASGYTAGDSISLSLTSSVSNTKWALSGTGASFLAVSGSSIVGSVPATYEEVTEISLTIKATTTNGQTASKTISFTVEPVLTFTTVPTISCIVNPVYEYDDAGNPIIPEASMLAQMLPASADMVVKTTAVEAVFTGTNAKAVVWDWGDGTTSEGPKAQHAYSEPGVYTVTLSLLLMMRVSPPNPSPSPSATPNPIWWLSQRSASSRSSPSISCTALWPVTGRRGGGDAVAASAVTKLPQIAGSLSGLKNVISKLGSSTWFKGALAGLGTFFGFEWLTSGGLVESTSSALGVSETTGSILIIVALLGVGYLAFRFIDGKISEKGKR